MSTTVGMPCLTTAEKEMAWATGLPDERFV
jgi:hypothetical protein